VIVRIRREIVKDLLIEGQSDSLGPSVVHLGLGLCQESVCV